MVNDRGCCFDGWKGVLFGQNEIKAFLQLSMFAKLLKI